MSYYDLIVIGGGHAGCEAAFVASKLGAKTLLVTADIENLGQMSCNPSIGGVGKGILVKEIGALGGMMCQAIDQAGIQFKVLNRSKGPAVWGPRAQADRKIYQKTVKDLILGQNGLEVLADLAEDLVITQGRITGVITKINKSLSANKVILTTGTFLNGAILLGTRRESGGRIGEKAVSKLSNTMRSYNLQVKRLKTGTPPRLDGTTINWDATMKQPGDDDPVFFGYKTNSHTLRQIDCYITRTNEKTHKIVEENLHLSGHSILKCNGPRYCPSIEAKILRFKDKESHQIFLEPEGLETTTVYPNGISTALPLQIQQELINSITGLEKTKITKTGYSVEYDHIDPLELFPSLETKKIRGLYLAGQINGTTGYEEAAAQGLIAGINAVLDNPPLDITRNNSYIGVMIDDLTTLGIGNEPYRMFTSRAEYRLNIRYDNADERLTPIGYKLGIIDQQQFDCLQRKQQLIADLSYALKSFFITPNTVKEYGITIKNDGIKRSLWDIVGNTPYEQILAVMPEIADFPKKIYEHIKVICIYEPYLKKQSKSVKSLKMEEFLSIPKDINYHLINGISNEAIEKLTKVQPLNIGIAKRIPGVTPSAIIAIIVYLKKHLKTSQEKSSIYTNAKLKVY